MTAKRRYLVAVVGTDTGTDIIDAVHEADGIEGAKELLYELLDRHPIDAQARQEREDGYVLVDRWHKGGPLHLGGWLRRIDVYPLDLHYRGEPATAATWRMRRAAELAAWARDNVRSALIRDGWPKDHPDLAEAEWFVASQMATPHSVTTAPAYRRLAELVDAVRRMTDAGVPLLVDGGEPADPWHWAWVAHGLGYQVTDFDVDGTIARAAGS